MLSPLKASGIRRACLAIFAPSLLWLNGAICTLTPSLAWAIAPPDVRVFSAPGIGTDGTCWTTVQTPDGVLHFGSNSLLSFDGANWRQEEINGAFGFRSLDLAPDGRLWAGATDEIGWFERQPTGNWSYHSLSQFLPAEHRKLGGVWHVFAEEHGAVFVTAEMILRWDGKNFQVWSMPGGKRITAARCDGTIYFNHLPTGLYALGPTGPRLVIPESVLGKAGVLWMESNPAGLLLAGWSGLFNYREGKLEPFAPEASALARSKMITGAVRLPDGRLAVATFQGGIVLIRPDGALDRVIDDASGLPTRAIYSLFVDRDHALWATTESKIIRLDLSPASTLFDQRAGLPAQGIIKIVRSEGLITAATSTGLLALQPDQANFRPAQPDVQAVLDVQATPRGLVIGWLRGVQRLENGKLVDLLSTRQESFLTKPSRLWPDHLLVASGLDIILLDPAGASRSLIRNLSTYPESIAEDNQGRVWLGTFSRGVWVARPSPDSPVEAILASRDYGLPDIIAPSYVVSAPGGQVLVLTSAGGWILGRNASRFEPIQNFPSWLSLARSEVAADGTMWVVHPGNEARAACIGQITIKGDRAIWQPHSAEGLWNIGVPYCIFAERNGAGQTTLWIGGTTGILRHVVRDGPFAPKPQTPVLRSLVRVRGTGAWQAITQSLPYSTPAIAFEFAEPDFARRPALRLETQLDGVDPHWVPADASERREFTALRDGRYTFRVRAVAETGVASDATTFQFEITPPWWRTQAALVAWLLAVGPAVYGVYRWRVRSLRRRNSELEQKVLDRTVELVEASAAKTQFVANMSHDIRNPLNGIFGLALALENTPLDEKQSELVATLRECTTYLSTLVDDVLDFASIEAGRVELRSVPFSPADLLRSIATALRTEAIASGATLVVEPDPQLPPTCIGDAGRIQQILVNYVSNALKYSGGRIVLSVGIPADAPTEIEFAVADHGPGIDAAGQTFLFTKFTRLTGSHSREITGTGLGLASCRLLAGLMHGSVGVHSQPGQGARFNLRLPLEVSRTSLPAPAINAAVPNCTVLVVEDTNYNALAAAAVLAKFGLSCERAATGAEALQLFAEKRFNLVLLDRNLPDMDGTEVARRIRALEGDGPRAILLAVTAYCTTEDRALCLNAGMDAFLGKPLTPEKLRRVLTAAGRRHLAAASMHVSPSVVAKSVDVSLLEYIADGTDEGLRHQIELFLAALEIAETELNASALSGDPVAVSRAAHGVLSQARLVGNSALATAAAGLEQAARDGDDHVVADQLPRVRHHIKDLKAAMRRYPNAERPV